MTERINRKWCLVSRPVGMVQESNFEPREEPVPALTDGQILVRTLYVSFDPAMRGWLDDRPSYLPPVGLGDVMRAGGVGEVVESRNPDFAVGDVVQGLFGWQEWAVVESGGMRAPSKVPAGVPLTLPLSVLGTTGLTAYFGLLDLGEPKEGETVVVSGAAGATGSVAGQIAKLKGCRVIGIAGGPEKCRWLTESAGFDAAIDYKRDDVGAKLSELCPKGIDIYFDNVGGEILDACLARIADRARVVLCGGISSYNEKEQPPGPRNLLNLIIHRGRMEGFIVIDYLPRFGEAVGELGRWVSEGKIVYQEDVQEGIENAPATFLRLFQGKNVGKQLLKIAEPQGGA
ncbi:MAG: NADP-dependent oxidoreductase [Proteobacteria bacterium]|nr:NADP-dependent oxidoreductase [Pseudomonadota bacterium]